MITQDVGAQLVTGSGLTGFWPVVRNKEAEAGEADKGDTGEKKV